MYMGHVTHDIICLQMSLQGQAVVTGKSCTLTLLLVPFSYKLMQHLKPFVIWMVLQCWFPKWFWMVGQLIQNLVWIFPHGRAANTKPCLDTSKWWINGPSETIFWLDLNGSTACYQHCSNGTVYHRVCTKPMGIFESGNFEWFQMFCQKEG